MACKHAEKKKQQLGMNFGTASARMKKDVMFRLIQKCGEDICYQCGEKIEKVEDLSVEHKTPWLDSEDPIGLFFSQENITFSHLKCNVAAARRPQKKYHTREERLKADRIRKRKFDQTPEAKEKRKIRRRKRFEATGEW